MRRYEYEQTSCRLGDARADNGAVFVASEAVAKLSGLHYMSYECVPVTSPGAGAWTRLVWREYGDETGSRSPDLLVVSVPAFLFSSCSNVAAL